MSEAWTLRGELVLSCSCTVFCPCTLSLGLAPPTEGYCQTWAGIRIDEGRFGDVDLSGVKAGLIDSEYWIAPDITVARAEKSRVRAFGRNWNFAGRSAEVCALDWGNG